jgi:mRNA-degrading endonuclease toxin of MazEF toxin-antitoxin module
VLVVPCTTSLTAEVPSLCVEIEPDDTNGFDRPNWAIAHGVTSASKRRIVRETTYFISPQHLSEIRSHIAEALDIA